MYEPSPLDEPGRAARIKALIDDAKAACERLQRYYVQQAAEVGQAKDALQYVEDTIIRIPDELVPPETEIAANKFHDYVMQVEQRMMVQPTLDVASHAYALSTNVSSTASFSASFSLSPISMPPEKPAFWPHDRLTNIPARLARLHPPLVSVFESAKESFLAGVADPERQALWAMRQLLDHFFAALAPDDAVRASAHFKLKETPGKENQIYRIERILFAAHERVRDDAKRQVLVANAQNVSSVHERLNEAHARRPLRRDEVQETLRAVLALVDEWTGSLSL